MENPHEARQAVLLERIGKNVEKCHEAIQELNVCLNVSSAGYSQLSLLLFTRTLINITRLFTLNPLAGDHQITYAYYPSRFSLVRGV